MTRSAAFALARRSSAPVLAAGLLAASLTLGGCENPKPRPNGGGAPAAPAVPPVIGQDGKPVAMVAEGMPAPPAWAAAAIGKPLAEAYPKTSTCKGHTDIVGQGFGGAPRGVEIQGWGWDVAANAKVARVLLTDADRKIIGAGESGVARPDVVAAIPEIKDGETGWKAQAPVEKGPLLAFGLTADGGVCDLGRLEFGGPAGA